MKITAKHVALDYLSELEMAIFMAVEAKECENAATEVDYCLRDAAEKIVELAEKCESTNRAWAFLPALEGIFISLQGECPEWESQCPNSTYNTIPAQLADGIIPPEIWLRPNGKSVVHKAAPA